MAKVICAFSGGIDSSVAALLLKKEGFEVLGAFLRLQSSQKTEAEVLAKKVANYLKIPFLVFDFSKEFKKEVIESCLKEFKKGKTPNPCVVCNKKIKFGIFLKKALKLADFLATGHYVKKRRDFGLSRAKDKKKDQSYFLWQLSKNQIEKTLFPLGDLTRVEVERLAKKFKLPNVGIKKSVDLCFVKGNFFDFLKKNLGENPGKIVDKNGKVLGEHKGLWFYTIGQRRGLFLAKGPWWVLSKNVKKNLLIVTNNEKDLLCKKLLFNNANWIEKNLKFPLKACAKIRYLSNFSRAKVVQVSKKTFKAIFLKPQRAPTPGQSIVFYQKEKLLGGGIIK